MLLSSLVNCTTGLGKDGWDCGCLVRFCLVAYVIGHGVGCFDDHWAACCFSVLVQRNKVFTLGRKCSSFSPQSDRCKELFPGVHGLWQSCHVSRTRWSLTAIWSRDKHVSWAPLVKTVVSFLSSLMCRIYFPELTSSNGTRAPQHNPPH